jgi:hypothetical protein
MTCPLFLRTALLAAAGWVMLVPAAVVADEPPIQDNLDEVIRQKAPALNKYLRSKNYANVGVLKFLVKKGDAAPNDNVGELNVGIANRLEVALVLSNPDDDLGIIQQASKTVTKENNVRANHLTKEGRKAFFSHQYDLAWGPRKVDATAFVTGLVTISSDLKKTTLKIQVFDRDGNIQDVFDEITLETTPRILTESGGSYLLMPELHKEAFAQAKKDKGNRFPRSTLVDKIEVQTALVDPSVTKTEMKEPNPYREGPVKLTILYNGKPQRIDERGNVAEPKETDVVTFILENPTKDTYAVLLKVNGVNTLFAETLNDPNVSHKWILKPGERQVIEGFQINENDVDEFKVLSPKESEANEVNYGAHAGTFHMACFKGAVVKDDPSIETNKTKDEVQVARAAIARGNLKVSDIPAGSLNALKRDLRGREKAGDGARGMIVQGPKKGKKEVERLFFKPDQTDPVHDVTIRYYVPKRQ